MNRVRKNQKIINIAMEPRMRRIMEKLKRDVTEEYFDLSVEERNEVAGHISKTVIHTTIEILNGYNSEELPDIMELAINNLTSLEHKFVEMEMYAQAAMMFDAIRKIEKDINELIKNNTDGKITN